MFEGESLFTQEGERGGSEFYCCEDHEFPSVDAGLELEQDRCTSARVGSREVPC